MGSNVAVRTSELKTNKVGNVYRLLGNIFMLSPNTFATVLINVTLCVPILLTVILLFLVLIPIMNIAAQTKRSPRTHNHESGDMLAVDSQDVSCLLYAC